MEEQPSGGAATQQAILLSVVMIGGIFVTALIAGYAIFGQLLVTTGSLNALNSMTFYRSSRRFSR
jgi:hypothetical protein